MSYKSLAFRLFILLGVLALILAACQPAPTPAPPAPPPVEKPTEVPTQPPPPPPAPKKLEIFSWWTTGGEAAGLLKMFDIYNAKIPDVEIINATVAGGAGFEAKAVLKARMLGGDPPGSFQVHMGRELTDTWVVNDYMDPLNDLFKEEGWDKVFPPGVLEIVSYDGKYWSVPVNIHRSNVLWFNKKVFTENAWTPPATFEEFFALAEQMKAKGITPLALGDVGIWASTHLFEVVLAGTLGPEKYNGLWTGETDWGGPEVKLALENMAKMLEYANPDHSALSWDQANDLVIQGKAGMTIMGDWVDADNLAKKFADSGWAPPPATQGIFVALSDTFGMPKGAPNPELVIEWLRIAGSKAGQEAFNPVKGSICARNDCDAALFGPYLQSAMQDWAKDTIVASLAHGASASESWVTYINDVMTVFVTDRDVAKAQAGLVQACKDAKVCK
ncbi:MAG: ABC transporter substrate-binding protein [Anaerolineaceae bacterium]|nr:ABC transporter substrate-binding protein [Anaerolineaceae bacterium]